MQVVGLDGLLVLSSRAVLMSGVLGQPLINCKTLPYSTSHVLFLIGKDLALNVSFE